MFDYMYVNGPISLVPQFRFLKLVLRYFSYRMTHSIIKIESFIHPNVVPILHNLFLFFVYHVCE